MKMMLVSPETKFHQLSKQSDLYNYVVQRKDLYGLEEELKCHYKNYFQYALSIVPPNEILSYIRTVSRSLLHAQSPEVREALEIAIASFPSEKYISICGEAISKADEGGYEYKPEVKQIEMVFTFRNRDSKILEELRSGVNQKVDIFTYLFSEEEKNIVNKFKMSVFNKLVPVEKEVIFQGPELCFTVDDVT